MEKLFILLLSALLFVACSTDDSVLDPMDNGDTIGDIIGDGDNGDDTVAGDERESHDLPQYTYGELRTMLSGGETNPSSGDMWYNYAKRVTGTQDDLTPISYGGIRLKFGQTKYVKGTPLPGTSTNWSEERNYYLGLGNNPYKNQIRDYIDTSSATNHDFVFVINDSGVEFYIEDVDGYDLYFKSFN